MILKKAISPVVASALLLVVAVVSVVGFSSWMSEFSSGVFVDVEKDSLGSSSVRVNGIYNNELYLKSSKSNYIELLKISSKNYGEVCNFQKNNSYNFSDGLVTQWKFDDQTSSVIKDYSGNGYDGVLYGITKLLLDFEDGITEDKTGYNLTISNFSGYPDCSYNGVSGNSCYFNGSGQQVRGNFKSINDFQSVSFWIKPRFNNLNLSSRILRIGPLYLMKHQNNSMYFTLSDGVGYPATDTSSHILQNNSFIHVLVNFFESDNDFKVQLFVNSKLDFEYIYYNTSPSYIQGFHIGGSDNFIDSFNGYIDEFAVYDRVLSTAEIKRLYNSRQAEFIEILESKLDNAVYLDGVNNYINITGSEALNFNSNLTVISVVSNVFKKSTSTIISKTQKNGSSTYSLINTSFTYDINNGNSRFFRYNEDDFLNTLISVSYDLDFKYNSLKNDFFAGVYSMDYGILNYYNGDLKTSSPGSINILENDVTIKIGDRMIGDGRNFKGSIEEIRLYNRVISPLEMESLYWSFDSNINNGVSTINLKSCNLTKNIAYNIFGFTSDGVTFDEDIFVE